MSSSPPTAKDSSSSLRDVILTLPGWTLSLLVAGMLATFVVGGWVAWTTDNDALRSAAAQAVVWMLPLGAAIIAAVGVRRDSTRQIDVLTDRFLAHTVLERLRLSCVSGRQAVPPFPFEHAALVAPPGGCSYARYRLRWRHDLAPHLPEAEVAVKMNVLNFEIIGRLDVPQTAGDVAWRVADRSALAELARDPLMGHFVASVQGAIEEGYAVAMHTEPCARPGRRDLVLSMRQKVGAEFLTSPFLKRYFAEDAAIAIGVLHDAWWRSGLAPARPQDGRPTT